jgi:hypothetical protein
MYRTTKAEYWEDIERSNDGVNKLCGYPPHNLLTPSLRLDPSTQVAPGSKRVHERNKLRDYERGGLPD